MGAAVPYALGFNEKIELTMIKQIFKRKQAFSRNYFLSMPYQSKATHCF